MSIHTTIRLGANLLENSYFENASISKIYLGTNLLYNNIADFALTETLKNVTVVGTHPTTIERDGSLALQYAPAANYELPDSVAVAGATSDWNRLTGTLNVSNPTAAVTINVVGVALSKTIPEAPYTLKAAPSLTATHANFPFKTNFITGDSITVGATGITYNLEGNYGSTKVYDAATQTWAKAEYQSVTPTEDAKVSEAFYAWWEANIMSKLATPTGVQVADDEASWNEVENALEYEFVVDNASWGTYTPAVYDYTFDQSTGVLTLLDAPHVQNGDTVLITDEKKQAAKGDIITIEDKQYRVLKANGNIAEVLCMYDASTSVKFDSASSGYNNTYAGKNIDTYCNSTFYSGLSAAMKNAIVDKTFTQDSWTWASSVPTPSHYTGKYGSNTYYLTPANAAFGTSITRHCYVLSVQDVLDYLNATTSMGISDTTLTDTNIWNMFWNQSTSPGTTFPWLRSAYASHSDFAFDVYGYNGYLGYSFVVNAYAFRPAFQIDLSKISWTK